MIAWKPTPFIFIHIPKCAGTSIEQALLPTVLSHKTVNALTKADSLQYWLPGSGGRQHARLRDFESHYPLKEYYKFALVRNPWDRAISQITYLRERGTKPLFQAKDFKENLWNYCRLTTVHHGHDLRLCQIDYLQNASGELAVDFIGRFESLQVDFSQICAKLGIQPTPELPHIYDAKRISHFSEYYDAESAGWISHRFRRDIEAFGYKFE